MQAGGSFVGSVYGPISYPPLPLLAFRVGPGGVTLAAAGALRSVDPDRLVIKKIVLSGGELWRVLGGACVSGCGRGHAVGDQVWATEWVASASDQGSACAARTRPPAHPKPHLLPTTPPPLTHPIHCHPHCCAGYPVRVHKTRAVVRLMFFNPDDVRWFKPLELWTKSGRRGRITEPLGTHGAFKARFDGPISQVRGVGCGGRVVGAWLVGPSLSADS